jgi:hypothetical protein
MNAAPCQFRDLDGPWEDPKHLNDLATADAIISTKAGPRERLSFAPNRFSREGKDDENGRDRWQGVGPVRGTTVQLGS